MIFGSFVQRSWAAAADPILAMFGSRLVAYHAPSSIQTDGAAVTGWRDISGRGNHLEVRAGTPTLITLDGRPAVECADAHMGQIGGGIAAAASGYDKGFAIIQWAQYVSTGATASPFVWRFWNSSGSASHRMFAFTGGTAIGLRRTNDSGTQHSTTPKTPASTADRVYLHSYVSGGSPSNTTRVGDTTTSASALHLQNMTVDSFQIGFRSSVDPSGNVLRFSHNIVVDRPISSSEIAAVVAYLEGT